MMFSKLRQGSSQKWWSPLHPGGRAKAEQAMAADSTILECSIYRGGRFVGTVKPEHKKEGNNHG
jgi:hypothetical protein